MADVVVKQMPAFKKVYKKLHPQERAKVNAAIRTIIKTPQVGQEKKGNLSGIFVYKFKVNCQLRLLAYEWYLKEIITDFHGHKFI